MSDLTRFPGKGDFLYRCFDAEGSLLYIGITVNPVARFMSGHLERSPWAINVRRIDIEPIPEGWAAVMWERKAIIEGKPLYNIVHNDGAEWGRPKEHTYSDEDCQEIAEAWKNSPVKNTAGRAEAVRSLVDEDGKPRFPRFKVSTWYTLKNAGRVK
jgi:hypothetical protein